MLCIGPFNNTSVWEGGNLCPLPIPSVRYTSCHWGIPPDETAFSIRGTLPLSNAILRSAWLFRCICLCALWDGLCVSIVCLCASNELSAHRLSLCTVVRLLRLPVHLCYCSGCHLPVIKSLPQKLIHHVQCLPFICSGKDVRRDQWHARWMPPNIRLSEKAV